MAPVIELRRFPEGYWQVSWDGSVTASVGDDIKTALYHFNHLTKWCYQKFIYEMEDKGCILC